LDSLVKESLVMTGGAYNVESAASRLGLKTLHAGTVGTGVYGNMVLDSMRQDEVDFVGRRLDDVDTGYCFTMVEPDGERSFVTYAAAEAMVTVDQLMSIEILPTDAVYISGYDLSYASSREAVKQWILSDHADIADIFFDPSTMVSSIDMDVIEALRHKAYVITLNEMEYEVLSPRVGEEALFLQRNGIRDTVLFENANPIASVPTYAVEKPLDTTGAGDVHTGALIASLASGMEWHDAIARANKAAAYSVTQKGGACGPTAEVLGNL
jgi:sugar/nucleoside kinase (ribokinase family)